MPLRDLVGAMEKALAEDLERAGYVVLNTVKWSRTYDEAVWKTVRSAFAEHFEMLKEEAA